MSPLCTSYYIEHHSSQLLCAMLTDVIAVVLSALLAMHLREAAFGSIEERECLQEAQEGRAMRLGGTLRS